MSRIGKKPVQVPAGVTATVEGQKVTAKGPKGELFFVANDEIKLELENNAVSVQPANDSKDARSKWGMSRTMIENIFKGVKKYDNDIGYSLPEKMQVAIYQAGYFRMIAALIGGTATRLFGRHGDFYRIAGNRISEIDGFNPDAMAPFDKFAMIGPGDPDGYAQRIEDAFGIPTVIIDGNNINVEVLGASKGLPVDRAKARRILLDNPMGQDDEMTPIMLCRKRP